MPIDHQWIKTDNKEAGMGPTQGNSGNAGNESGDFPGDPVKIADHTNRDKTGATCRKVRSVDESIVDELLEIDKSLGEWWPNNQCQTFVNDVLDQADLRTALQKREDALHGINRFSPAVPYPSLERR